MLLERHNTTGLSDVKSDSPIRLSGDHRMSESSVIQSRESVNDDFWLPEEPDYSSLLLSAYQRLSLLCEADPDVALEEEIAELEKKEGIQVQRLLKARLHLKPEEAQSRLDSVDALLAKYGEAPPTPD